MHSGRIRVDGSGHAPCILHSPDQASVESGTQARCRSLCLSLNWPSLGPPLPGTVLAVRCRLGRLPEESGDLTCYVASDGVDHVLVALGH